MKIGLVRRGYSPTGGAEQYLRRLAVALIAAGHSPTLFAGPEWPPEQRPVGSGFIAVPGRNPRAFADQLARLAVGRCDRLFSLERVWRCDCYRAGDGVHRAWLARRARAECWWQPLLRTLNGKHRQILALEENLFAHGGARTVIANSQLVRREIMDLYGTPADRIAVVYNGLPVEHFQPVADDERVKARAALNLAPDDYAILFAGTGWERKGLRHLLRAVDRLPDSLSPVLLVAGRGNPRPFLRSRSEKGKARVRFLGPVNNMRSLYVATDVFAAPTLYDPFANACLEALAAGLPVVTTSANGFSEVIEPGRDGEVFDPADAKTGEALAALLAKWSDPVLRTATQQARLATARRFTIEKNVAETLSMLLQ